MNIDFINKRKKALGLTNQMIADRTGITLSTLDKITSGINNNPKLSTMKAIASVLNCRLDDFDSSNPSISIGERIKEARIRRGLTQQQLAETIGVANNTITGYEKGTREPDSLKINAIAKALNVSGDYLLGTEYDWLPSSAAMIIAAKYDRLDTHSRETIDWLIDHELKRPCAETTTIEENTALAESRRIDDDHADEQAGG